MGKRGEGNGGLASEVLELLGGGGGGGGGDVVAAQVGEVEERDERNECVCVCVIMLSDTFI